MEIWHTGADDTELGALTGWLGRYFDAQCAGADPRHRDDLAAVGLNIGKIMPHKFPQSFKRRRLARQSGYLSLESKRRNRGPGAIRNGTKYVQQDDIGLISPQLRPSHRPPPPSRPKSQ